MISQEKREVWISILGDVAERLSRNYRGDWEVKDPPDDRSWLCGTISNLTTGFSIFLDASVQDKISISGIIPRDSKGNEPYLGLHVARPKITVSASKSVGEIASDIERRLYPKYKPLLKQAVEKISSTENYHSKIEDMAAEIAKLVKVKVSSHAPHDVSFYESPFTIFHETSSSASVSGEDDVKVELHLCYEDAVALLKYITHQ